MEPRIVVAGAGSIGCFVGGLLAKGGHDVTLLARPRIADAIAGNGLHLTDYAGLDLLLQDMKVATTPEILARADIVLVSVKSGATRSIAEDIAGHTPAGATVVSLQNGIENAPQLRQLLPSHVVRAGMVPFNVVAKGPSHFHRATSGDIVVEAGSDLAALSVPQLAITESDHIGAIQWGKLLLNLNNALNALSDLPLLEQLRDRDWRRLNADQMAEALAVLKAAGIAAQGTTAVPPWLIPHIMRLPTWAFSKIAAQNLTIDPEARSSMWEDLVNGRATEIDALQGRIIRLGQEHGVETPLTERIADRLRQAEKAGSGPPGLKPSELRRAS